MILLSIPITGIEKIIKKGAIGTIEKTYLTKDGRKIPILFSSSAMYTRLTSESLTTHDATDNILGIVCVAQDITERKKAEGTLRESEQRFRGLVENTTDWIWEVNEHTRYTYASPQVRKLLGYEPNEVIGMTPFDLMTLEDQQRVRKMFVEIAGRQEPFSGLENSNLHKDGHTVILETSGVPIFSSDGTFRGYRGIDRNITERKKAEEILQEQKKALEKKNIALNEVLGQIELEKKQIKDNVIANAEKLLLPIMQRLRLKGESRKYVQLLRNNLQELTSSFGTRLTEKEAKLTSREIEICNMIKNGLTNKEIANLLNITHGTIERHRANIRNKLSIVNKNINLSSFLKTL